MGKYQNKYRIDSSRARWWDYGWNGAYFITICTRDREHFFGEIENEKMVLNPLGAIAYVLWHEIPHRMKYVELGEFVVMPNHIHGILIIDKSEKSELSHSLDSSNLVQTRLIASPLAPQDDSQENPPEKNSLSPGGITGKNNPMIQENISKIIRWYKGRCTFEIRKTNLDFAWQTRFHDHIIRSDADYERISNYIINNPKSWGEDKLNVKK